MPRCARSCRNTVAKVTTGEHRRAQYADTPHDLPDLRIPTSGASERRGHDKNANRYTLPTFRACRRFELSRALCPGDICGAGRR